MWAVLLMNIGFANAAEMWSLKGMTCQGCADLLTAEVALYPPLKLAYVSAAEKRACFEDSESFREHRQSLLDGLANKDLPIDGITVVDSCPAQVTSFWTEAIEGDLDVTIVSTHDRFSMRKARKKNRYTLFDFGALWCGPCLEGSQILTSVLSRRKDIAIQAIEIEGPASTAFETPVAFQHLSNADGLPYFVLYSPKRKKIYSGSELDRVLELLGEDPQAVRTEAQPPVNNAIDQSTDCKKK